MITDYFSQNIWSSIEDFNPRYVTKIRTGIRFRVLVAVKLSVLVVCVATSCGLVGSHFHLPELRRSAHSEINFLWQKQLYFCHPYVPAYVNSCVTII
jgi:hypothetical protein